MQQALSWCDPANFKVYMLRELVNSAFASWLATNGFSEAEYVFDDKAFGNEILVYRSPDAFMRFVNDRGDVYIDVSPPTQDSPEWFLLDNLLQLLGYAAESFTGGRESQMRNVIEALNTDFPRLKAMLRPADLEQTRKDMEELCRSKIRQMFPR